MGSTIGSPTSSRANNELFHRAVTRTHACSLQSPRQCSANDLCGSLGTGFHRRGADNNMRNNARYNARTALRCDSSLPSQPPHRSPPDSRVAFNACNPQADTACGQSSRPLKCYRSVVNRVIRLRIHYAIDEGKFVGLAASRREINAFRREQSPASPISHSQSRSLI